MQLLCVFQTAANFEWLNPPTEQSVSTAIETLMNLGAIVRGEIKDTFKVSLFILDKRETHYNFES